MVSRARIVHPSVTKEILEAHGIRLTKRLGQHFLIDENVLNKEVEAAGIQPTDTVVEVGPGIGTLTQPLAERAAKVITIEYDKRFIGILEETLSSYKNIEIVNADALKTDISGLLGGRGHTLFIANLPYGSATQIITQVLEHVPEIESMVVMVQKEAADRLLAAPGSKEYGFYTVRTAFFADIERISKVKRTVFLPPPRVDSGVIRIIRRPDASVIASVKDELFFFIKACFNERRKTLGALISGRLKETYGAENESRLLQALDEEGVGRRARPGDLTYEQFFRIFCVLRPRRA